MKKLLVLVTLVVISCLSCLAQRFTVTEIKSRGISENELQEKKVQMLGATFDISIYDTSVKVKVTTTENEYTTIVLDESPDKHSDYFCQIGENHYFLTLNKSFGGEATSATFSTAEINPHPRIFWYTLKKKY
ncbi:hypothetical protein [uncultured Draconibacterium sp.]|uniref:hypothetical protein n=1 Tax=uncultured Draconibacterium sp. TaxID=1573823 RepID=UPI00326157A8